MVLTPREIPTPQLYDSLGRTRSLFPERMCVPSQGLAERECEQHRALQHRVRVGRMSLYLHSVRVWEGEQAINIWHHNCSEVSKLSLGAAAFGERRWGNPVAPSRPPDSLLYSSHFPKTPGLEGSDKDWQALLGPHQDSLSREDRGAGTLSAITSWWEGR